MRAGKVSAAALRARVYPHLGRRRPDVLVRAGIGRDCAVLDFGPSACVVTADPITGAAEHIGRLAVHVACNDLAAGGAEPVGLLLTVLLPESATEDDLDRLMAAAGRAAAQVGVEIVGGHTEVTPGLPRTLVVTAAIGRATRAGYVPPDGGRPGHALLLTKAAGLEGTAILAADLADRLRPLVGAGTLARAQALIEQISVVPDGRAAAAAGAAAMHDVTEGGVLAGAWELAEACGCGIRLNADAVPVLPETRAICEALALDPLALIGSGAMLVAAPDARPVCAALAAAGIPAVEVGQLTAGGRIVVRDGREAPLEPPERDELWRVLEPGEPM